MPDFPSDTTLPEHGSRSVDSGSEVPVKHTPVSGIISKKSVPVHTCELCQKTFTRQEHLRRHQLSHQKPAYPCTFEDCERGFHQPDLLARHMHRHETQGEKPYKSGDGTGRNEDNTTAMQFPLLRVPQWSPWNHQNLPQNISRIKFVPSSPDSITDSLFSTISETSSVKSLQSESVIALDLSELLLDVLRDGFELAILYDGALFRVGDERFKRNLGRLFQNFGTNLKREAHNQQEKFAARFVYAKAKNIARGVCQVLESRIYENEFIEQDEDCATLKPELSELDLDLDSSNDSAEEAVDVDDYMSHEEAALMLSNTRMFLHISVALKSLRTKLSTFLYPSEEYKKTRRGHVASIKHAIRAASSTTNLWSKYEIIWEVPEYLRKYCSPGQRLGDIMTITGNTQDAIAMRCQDYVEANWKEAGPVILDLIQQFILETPVEGTKTTVTRYTPEMDLVLTDIPRPKFYTSYKSTARLSVAGSQEIQVQVASCISWLCAAIRFSPFATVAMSTCRIQVMASDFQNGTKSIEISLSDIQEVPGDVPCWHSLFPRSVIAQQFAHPERIQGKGLEIAFADMALMARSMGVLEIDGGLVVRGTQTLLYPVEELDKDDAFQWHVEREATYGDWTSEAPSGFVQKLESSQKWFHALDLKRLVNRRAFLGWVPKVHMAITAPSFPSTIYTSGAPASKGSGYVKSYQLTIGSDGLGYFGATGSISWLPVSVPSMLMLPQSKVIYDVLKTALRRNILLYDPEEKIGWLLPEICVVFFMARCIIAELRCKLFRDDVESDIKYPSGDTSSPEATLNAIVESLPLRVCKGNSLGGPKSLGEPMDEFLLRIWNTLDMIRTRLYQANTQAELAGKSCPKYLRGVELQDTIRTETIMEIKEAPVQQPWTYLSKCQPIVLFIRGLPQSIDPISSDCLCEPWKVVPSGKNYLAATGKSVSNLLHQHNMGSNGSRLADQIEWRPRQQIIDSHLHGSSFSGTHTQALYKCKKPQLGQDFLALLQGYEDGGFVFGNGPGDTCPT